METAPRDSKSRVSQEFVLNSGQPSEIKVQKEAPRPRNKESGQPDCHPVSRSELHLRHFHDRKHHSKDKAIYINETRRSKYPTVLTDPPLTPSRPNSFSDADIMVVHFPYNDALIVTMLISNCLVSNILINIGNFIKLLYEGTLDRMEDTPEITRAMFSTQPSLICMDLTRAGHIHRAWLYSQFV